MIWVLLFLLIAFDIFLFILFDRNILSPSVLAVSMFVLSTLVACLNIRVWQFTISSYTVVMIMTSLFALGAGEFIVRLFYCGWNQREGIEIPKEPIEISTLLIICVCVVLCLLFIHYMQELMRVAIAAGYRKDEGLLFVQYVRKASLHTEVYGWIDRLAGWSVTFASVIAYVFLYILCYNLIFFKKIKFLYIIPVMTYLPYIVFSGGRTQFIYIIAFLIIVGGTFYLQKNRWSLKSVLSVIKAGLGGVIVFLCIFIVVGSLKNTSVFKSAFSTISFYTGMSIPSLDDYFLNPRPKGEYFGEHVLFGIYGFLREFNDSIPDFYAPYDFVSFNGTSGNVYTVIRRYHQDFGLLGLYGLMFFLGFFYSFFYLLVSKKSCFGLLLYGYIIAPIVEIAIEERFFMSVVSHSQLIIFMLLYCSFIVFIDGRFKESFSFRYNK